VTVPVLPALTLDRAHPTLVKRLNVLPLIGGHHHRRPGVGNELLELRDYRPGDPPKMIAWKASARRDKLMTRELESSVPIRCTLFLDASQSTRVGPVGATALARLVTLASGVTQVNHRERDLTGLCVVDDEATRVWIPPGRGSRHALRIAEALAHAASLPLTTALRDRDVLVYHAYGLLQDWYPDLLHDDVNAFPWWLPYWTPKPLYTVPGPRPQARHWWTVPLVALRRSFSYWLRAPLRSLWLRMSPFAHRTTRLRKRVAAAIAVLHNLGPGGLARLLEDDLMCEKHLQRWLGEHHVAVPTPLYDRDGNYLFSSPNKTRLLADALLLAVRRAKDNELFVLCADLLEPDQNLERLQHAVAVAVARHHQVIVMLPWPGELAMPGERTPPPRQVPMLHRLMMQASAARLNQAFARARHELSRRGALVLCAAADDAVDVVLERMQRLRAAFRGVR
jgi:hypothetical protein